MTATGRLGPARIVSLDISAPPARLDRDDPVTGQEHHWAWCLVWNGDRPAGNVVIEIPEAGLAPEEVAAALDRADLVERADARLDPAETPAITVVVATRDRPEMLRAALASVRAAAYEDLQILVVDSASGSTGTRDVVESIAAADPRVRGIRSEIPGLAVAHNAALPYVHTPLVAFTDDDVTVDRRWLLGLADGFAAGPDVGCVTGLIAPAQLETDVQRWIETSSGFNKGYERRVFDLTANRPDDPLFPFTAGQLGSGANMAFRTAALRKVGGFDPALGAGTLARGGDDLASFVSILAAGYQLVYEPTAVVFHCHHRTRERLRHQMRSYGAGYTAFLTSSITAHPALLPQLVRRLPAGVRHAVSPGSAKNARVADDVPSWFRPVELLGMLGGPIGYARSRRHHRRTDTTRSPS